jgi:hypothetical protein
MHLLRRTCTSQNPDPATGYLFKLYFIRIYLLVIRFKRFQFSGQVHPQLNSLGFGWLPDHSIQQQLASKQLKALNLRSGSSYSAQLYLVYANRASP